jgi:sec-independent protein translocase protein TatA
VPEIGPGELILLGLVALLLFGPKRLPEMGRGLGKGLREFKDSLSGVGEGGAESSEPPPAPTGGEPVADPVTARSLEGAPKDESTAP